MFPILVAQLPLTNSSCLTLQWLSIVLRFYCHTGPGGGGGGGDGNNETRARLGDSGRYTMRVLWSSGAVEHHRLSMKGGYWVLAPVNQHQHQHQHFLFGKHFNGIPLRDSLRSWPQCQHIFSLPHSVLSKCYRNLEQPWPASIEERFLSKSHFWKWRFQPTKSKNPLRRLVLSYNFQTTNYYMKASLCRYNAPTSAMWGPGWWGDILIK